MIGIEIRFLTGRFHANAWHHAHNEGVAEWPPSPWRILRALVAAAYELDVVAATEPLLKKLQALPRFRLPAAREAHTRHYMPDTDDAAHKKTKIFDTFVVVDGGTFADEPQPVTAIWPISVDAPERLLLERLATRVGYLGRAESWAELRIVDVVGDDADCWPDERDEGSSTTLMALEEPDTFAAWASGQPKPTKKGAMDLPRSTWDVLTFDGARFRSEGWSRVPGTRLARYVFAEPPFRRRTTLTRTRRTQRERPTVARYAIRSAVLPKITEALFVAERMRQGLMSQSAKVSGNAKPVFSGHFEDVSVAAHQHAFVLPSCDGNHEQRIDHITVSAKMGFDDDDIVSLQRVRRLYGQGGHFLELVLLGVGQAADFGGLTLPASPLLASSKRWRSITPFIPTRHPKLVRGEWIDTPSAQIKKACQQLGLPKPIDVYQLDDDDGNEWLRFRRRRKNGGGHRGPDRAHGVELCFAEEVRGPICLGFGAHFGLGTFVAIDEQA